MALITGSLGSDVLVGTGAADDIHTYDGADTVDGLAGDDRIYLGVGEKRVQAGAGDDAVVFVTWGGLSGQVDGGDGVDTGISDGLADVDLAAGTFKPRGGGPAVTLIGIENWTFVQGINSALFTNGRIFGDGRANRLTANTNASEGAVLDGRGGDDILFGSEASDQLIGGEGDDYLRPNRGADTLDGGAGFDLVDFTEDLFSLVAAAVVADLAAGVITNGAATNTIRAAGIEAIRGTDNTDILLGDGASNRFEGRGGADRLEGRAGADTLDGGAGDDRLSGDEGTDLLFGAAGADTLRGGADNDTLNGESGNDQLFGDAGDDLISGEDGDDRLFGAAGADFQLGFGGADLLNGEAGNDTLFGGEGGDVLSGESGDDALAGDAGGDELIGGAGRDTLIGGDGNDVLLGNADVDVMSGGAGDDRILYGDSDTVAGGAGRDTFLLWLFDSFGTGAGVITDFTSGEDRLDFGGFTVEVDAGAPGVYFIYTQVSGPRTLRTEVRGALNGDDITSVVRAFNGSALGDTLVGGRSNETISGNLGSDSLVGGGGNDVLSGGGSQEFGGGIGTDTLAGGDGEDRIFAGATDVVSGGAGRDTIIFDELLSGRFASSRALVMTIIDFERGQDVIDVSRVDANDAVAGDQAFAFVTGAFTAAGQARLIYDAAAAQTRFEGDVNGDGVADLVILINGQVGQGDGFVL